MTERRPTPLFVVGCPRSGTTWVQLLLAQHPEVATAQETHLFSRYLGPFYERWEQERRSNNAVGLNVLMDDQAVRALLRNVAEDVLGRMEHDRPARVIVEKTPQHVYYARPILDLFPDARFLHLVRDPRAVAASLIAASADWGKGWAPGSPVAAGHMWRDAIRAGRAIRLRTPNYRELRYEDLSARPVNELEQLFAWLTLDHDRELCAQFVERCSAERIAQRPQDVDVPESMMPYVRTSVRKGLVDAWREDLSRSQVAAIEYVAREEMQKYGYAPAFNKTSRVTLRVLAAAGANRARHVLNTVFDRVLQRL